MLEDLAAERAEYEKLQAGPAAKRAAPPPMRRPSTKPRQAVVARPEAATTPTRPFSTLAAAASAPETGPPAAPAPVAPAPEPICVDQLRLLNVELGIHPHATPDDTIARANDIMGFEPIGTPCEQLRKLVAAINVKLAAGLRYAPEK